MIPRVKALILESCDFEQFPAGGQLVFAKQMMRAFGGEIALVGVSTDQTPTGVWVKKSIGDTEFWYFAVARRRLTAGRPLVPARLAAYWHFARHRQGIMSLGVRNACVLAPEVLFAVGGWGWDSLCFQLHGTENPLRMSRYAWARPLSGLYDCVLRRAARAADVILAFADTKTVLSLAGAMGRAVEPGRLVPFTTRVDTTEFRPSDCKRARAELGIKAAGPVVVTCGRLNRVKGWDFVLSAFREFVKKRPEAQLVYVGDGEDRLPLQRAISAWGLETAVTISGFQPSAKVAKFLNAADLCVVGSQREGWSIAMLEALACGKAMVATDVSGARSMIKDGENGFVVTERNASLFANAMARAMELPNAEAVSIDIAEQYSLKTLARDIGAVWPPLA